MVKRDTSGKPAPPKRPLSAFFLYKQEVYEQVKKKHPSSKITELTKIIGDQWRELTSAAKQKYEQQQEKAKAAYEKDKKAYEEKYGKIVNKVKKEKKTGEKAKTTKKITKRKPAKK